MSIQDEVLDLIHRVPRAPEYQIPSGATEQNINHLSGSFGLYLPEELRQFLKLCNAPCIGPGGIFGVPPAPRHLLIESYYEIHPEWILQKWIPLAGDGVGNCYVLDTAYPLPDTAPVYFIDHEISFTEPDYIVASNLWIFLRFLLQAEMGVTGWPFNREFVLRADPHLQGYAGHVPFAWEKSYP
jgi:hypothetical protein